MTDLSVADFDEPAVTWAQAVVLVQERFGATILENEETESRPT